MQWFWQVISLVGALLILGAFVALQRRIWSAEHPWYLWCNLVGAGLLALVGVVERQLGFILLEAVWALISLQSLLKARHRPSTA